MRAKWNRNDLLPLAAPPRGRFPTNWPLRVRHFDGAALGLRVRHVVMFYRSSLERAANSHELVSGHQLVSDGFARAVAAVTRRKSDGQPIEPSWGWRLGARFRLWATSLAFPATKRHTTS